MFARLVSTVVATAALLVGVSAAARAETYQISLGEATAIINFPDTWKVTEIKRDAQIISPDKEVYMWFEAYAPDALEAPTREPHSYFKKQKVTIGKPRSQEMVLGGAKTVALDFPATYKGKKTIVQYLMIDPALKNGARLLVSNWSSVEGNDKYDKVEEAMLTGIKFRKK